jgi:RHS repeat-associated protein
MVAELNPATSAWTDYIGYGKRIAKDTSNNGTGAQYYHGDHLGSARIMTDATCTKIQDCTFNPFGEQVICSPDNASNHYRFTGKEHDNESGLDDFGARYFSSSMGRWATPDWSARPVSVPYANFGDPQSLNLYLYVRNDPVSNADADGHIDDNADPDHPIAPGLKPVPNPANAVEVSVGTCVCVGADINAGSLGKVNASAEPIGVEVKSTLGGNADAKVNIGKVGVGVTTPAGSIKLEGGAEVSAKNGVSAAGKASVSVGGVETAAKADTNGNTSVTSVKAEASKTSGELKLGIAKVKLSIDWGIVKQYAAGVAFNIPVIGGAFVNAAFPGAGTPSVGQSHLRR